MRNAYCAGPEDDLQLPKESAQVDWEVELGVVIGKGGRYAATIDFYVSWLLGISQAMTANSFTRAACTQNHSRCDSCCTDKKEKKIFFIYKGIQMGSVAKTYMRNGFLIYEEMRKH
jgi:hypothetical protein